MGSPTELIIAAISGALIGLAYFGGLWWTVHRLPSSPHPIRLYAGSMLIRLLTLLAGAFLVARHYGAGPLIAAAAGFTVARLLLVTRASGRLTSFPADKPTP
jgi:F1F0 ATPase subunit 2